MYKAQALALRSSLPLPDICLCSKAKAGYIFERVGYIRQMALPTLQVVTVLKKDVIKSQSKDLDKGDEYRQILVQAIHSCAIKFPAVAANVILLLMGAPLQFNVTLACVPNACLTKLRVDCLSVIAGHVQLSNYSQGQIRGYVGEQRRITLEI